MKRCLLFLSAVLASAPAPAETRYKLPPKEIVDILDARPTPEAIVSPARDAMLLVDYEGYPPIEFVSRPFLRIAGMRIDSQMGARQRIRRHTGITIQRLDGTTPIRVALPLSAKISLPVWSRDGKSFAFTRDLADGVELWVAETATGKARAIGPIRLNDVLASGRGFGTEGAPFAWLADAKRLLVRLMPAKRGPAPPAPRVPTGPVVEETAGKVSQVPTFEDLLKDSHDEDLFEYFGTSQLAVVDVASGAVTNIGAPGLVSAAELSPDEKQVLVTKLRRPFSYRVPYQSFTRSVEVWDTRGKRLATVADLPVSDETPRQGVPTGPRAVDWQPVRESTLVWVEALDGGDPLKKVPHRDKVMTLSAPFTEAPREVLQLKHRFAGFHWTARKDEALVEERDRDRRWTTTYLVDLKSPAAMRTVFDRSVNDAYGDPGQPVMETGTTGERTILQDADTIYLAGNGASESGGRPFLDKLDLKTLQKERVFQSGEASFDRFVSFVKGSRSSIVMRHESKTEPPNWFMVELASGKRTKLSDLPDPAPQFTRVRKELVRYNRKDGVPLSGTLFLPADYKPGTRLPLLIWAYPLEYSDAGTAGQVRASPNAFTRPAGASPIFFVTQGYAVLNDATMPVVGDPETMNNTYLEQVTASAEAAIAKLDAMGVIDPKRVGVGGHSYGAFMTANLLAHTELFAAGIARSGAYNRSLTPFGFQTERRNYWEATDLYTKVSPFTYANKIKQPILLIHGEADSNTGTFPIQSERLFQAIRGNGGTARLVMLPFEAHGYRARESILHTLAEMIEWADRYVKNRADDPHAAHREQATPTGSSPAGPVDPNLPPGDEQAKSALEKSPRHGEWVDIKGAGGQAIRAFVVYPERKDKAPVVIVIHDISGLSDWSRSVADQLAKEGFIAWAPDLISGMGPGGGGTDSVASRDDVGKLIRALTPEQADARLDAVRDYAIKLPASNGKSATVGFCWGGSRSFAYAVAQPALNAAVVYYGTAPEPERLATIRAPVLGLYGGDDARVNATIEATAAELKKLGRSYEREIFEGAGHGFLRGQSGRDGANLKATQKAWPRTVAFLKQHLEGKK